MSSQLSATEALALNSELQSWTSSLPYYYQMEQLPSSSYDWYIFARYRLWWRCWNLQIILTRPFLLQWAEARLGKNRAHVDNAEKISCRQVCIHSAHMTLITANEYVAQHSLSRLASWYTMYEPFSSCHMRSIDRLLTSLADTLPFMQL